MGLHAPVTGDVLIKAWVVGRVKGYVICVDPRMFITVYLQIVFYMLRFMCVQEFSTAPVLPDGCLPGQFF